MPAVLQAFGQKYSIHKNLLLPNAQVYFSIQAINYVINIFHNLALLNVNHS